MEEITGILILTLIGYWIYNSKKKRKYGNKYKYNFKNYNNYKSYTQEYDYIEATYINDENKIENEINVTYIKRQLLTNNERRYYEYLNEITIKYKYKLLAKIRLADLIEVNKKHIINSVEQNASFARIRSKHIDFAICRSADLQPILLIEIDDWTHQRADRIKRDCFVDSALRNAGFKIIHVNTINELQRILENTLGINNETITKNG